MYRGGFMAGYIMNIGAGEYLDMFYGDNNSKAKGKNKVSSKKKGQLMAKQYALEHCIRTGTYSARCSDKGSAFIGTLADYLGMKEGDNVFFFMERKVYGIGELVSIEERDCRFRIHPKKESADIEDLTEERDSNMHQFICTFKPSPYFFKQGVDMDEILMFSSDKIKSLRFFSGMTFMKLDDVESEAIKNIIARKNEEYLSEDKKEMHFEFDESVHHNIAKKISGTNAYDLSIFDYIQFDSKERVKSEYYIEGATMDLLRNYESKNIGKWDFVARQYPASPPKPSEYKETMDLFGYRYVPGFPGAVSQYIVIELKAGRINKDNVQQTMKYVDWISRKYTNGDYSMIKAYTIGCDKENEVEEDIKGIIERNYITDCRPVENKSWKELKILSYKRLLDELQNKDKS